MVADHARDPRPQVVGAEPAVDGAAQQRLGVVEPLGLDHRPERGGRITAEVADRVGNGLIGRSRSVSATPAMPWTIGSARWSPSNSSTIARQSVADATEWPQPNSARGAPWATASHTSSPGLASARSRRTTSRATCPT